MTSHNVTITAGPLGYFWQCECGAKGPSHADKYMATQFGEDHVKLSKPYVRESEDGVS